MKIINCVSTNDPNVLADTDALRRMWEVITQAEPLSPSALDYFFNKAVERYRHDHADEPRGGEKWDNRRAGK